MQKKNAYKYLVALIFFIFYFNFFIYIDIFHGCFIRLTPSFSIGDLIKTKRALKLIKAVSPDDYKKVCQNVNRIDLNMIFCPLSSDGCYNGDYNINKEKITVQGSDLILEDFFTPDYLAEIIVHETCHVIQLKENRPALEAECYAVNNRLGKMIRDYKDKSK